MQAPTTIKYHYNAWQKRFAEVEAADPRLEFVEGLSVFDDLPVGSEHTVMVIDDFMEEESKPKTAIDIFMKQSPQEHESVILDSKVVWANTQHKSHLTERTPYDIV